MDQIIGIQRAIDYIEAHLTDEIDYAAAAAQSFSSSYHFQRMFSILCGFTLGEYIRNRRLTLAGVELASEGTKVIDIALKYGYESPDSFAKAFRKFHGILPSEVRTGGKNLRSFSRLCLKISLEGGNTMDYRIETKPEMHFTGFKRGFTGTPAKRAEQECDFYLKTRTNQYILKGMYHDYDNEYNIITGFGDDGYDFYIAARHEEELTNDNLTKELGEEDAKRFESITVPEQLYLICETERTKYPTMLTEELRKQAVSEWLPSQGYELADAPEIALVHWFFKKGDNALNNSRYIELWLPITKTE
ncbi:MAG: AraC family transcriptional regulator [Ruminococcaceae bacterium]|nr:AraC family transcriptional regulator [Oscillospiraceae bacterium]